MLDIIINLLISYVNYYLLTLHENNSIPAVEFTKVKIGRDEDVPEFQGYSIAMQMAHSGRSGIIMLWLSWISSLLFLIIRIRTASDADTFL
jgi:hypothetical protein